MSLWALLIGAAAGWYLSEKRQRKTHDVPAGLQENVLLPHAHAFELYHNDFSLCSKKLRICLAELGIDYQAHPVDLIETGAYQTLSTEFLRVNPAGTVPVLVHNGHPIYESHVQIAYAAEHATTCVTLVPGDPVQREHMQIWVDRSSLTDIDNTRDSAGNCVPGLTLPIFASMIRYVPAQKILTGLLFHRMKLRPLAFLTFKVAGLKRFAKLGKPLAMLTSAREAMERHLDALEEQLETTGGPWILGADYSLADVSWVVIFERLDEVDWIEYFLGNGLRPEVSAYWERSKSRPSYQIALGDHVHPLVSKGRRDLVNLKAADPEFRRALIGSRNSP